MSSPALEQLRAATGAAHATLEQALLIARPDAGRADYLLYLQAMYGWLAPVEARLRQGAWPAAMQATTRCGKARWIEQDLLAAGMQADKIAALPVSEHLPMMDTQAARLGVAYVVEGAQLGGQVLRKRLAPIMGSWSPRWLQGYGEQTGRMWKTFTACTEEMLTTPQQRRQAALAANAAFTTLLAWFEARGAAALL